MTLGSAGATLDLVIDGWRITCVRSPEKQAVPSSWTEISWRIGNLAAGAGLVETVWTPIRDLLRRLGPMAPPILLLVAGFRMPGYIATAMAVPLFKHQGFSNTDIATVTKLFGFWIGLGGTFLAGALIPRSACCRASLWAPSRPRPCIRA